MRTANPYESNDREVTLVDLATIFVRRVAFFYIVFILVAGAGISYGLLAVDKHEYVSLYKVAEGVEGTPIEPVANTIAALRNLWLPALESEYQQSEGRSLQLNVDIANPAGTPLIRLSTNAPQTKAELVRQTHQSLISEVEARQLRQVEHVKKEIQRQLESVQEVIESLSNTTGGGQALSGAVREKVRLQGEESGISPPEVMAIAHESSRRVGPNVTLIVVISVILGLVLGVISAFLAEFVSLVRGQVSRQRQGV